MNNEVNTIIIEIGLKHYIWLALISAIILQLVDFKEKSTVLMKSDQMFLYFIIFVISILCNILVDKIIPEADHRFYGLAITALFTLVVSLLLVIATNISNINVTAEIDVSDKDINGDSNDK